SNQNANNSTFVDGSEIQSKVIRAGSKIYLGAERYPLDIDLVKECAELIINDGKYSGAELEAAYKEFMAVQDKVQKEREMANKMRSIPMIIGVLTALITGVLKETNGGEMNELSYVTLCLLTVSIIVMVYNFMKKDNTKQMLEEAKDELVRKYKCPKCGKYIQQDILVLKENGECPYCKAKYVFDT
ncbi:MAG: hypothetical protein ACI4SO_00755, partial [Muribaculaceae bacterium]